MFLAFFQAAAETGAIETVAEFLPSGLGAFLIWVVNRVVSPVVAAANSVTKHFAEADDHREAEAKHWKREEELLQKIVATHVLVGEAV